MEKLLQFFDKEFARAKSIYEELDKKDELDGSEQADVEYYQGYADGIAEAIVCIRMVQEGKDLP